MEQHDPGSDIIVTDDTVISVLPIPATASQRNTTCCAGVVVAGHYSVE